MSASEIFTKISPAIAFIETSVSTGSGVLIQGGHVVTNAHVVWPFQSVRVVFPDGSEYLDAPVRNWDLMGDLAVIGPLDSDISPLPLLDGEDLIIGSDLFLIGYPGEAEEFPQPTISKGLLSRLRQWDAIEITYFQTDAAVAGGQSGGVLVSEKGKAIGITGLLFTEAQFGLVASSADILPRIDALIAGQDVAGIGDRKLPMRGGQLEHNISLEHDWDSRVYVVNEPIGTDVSIRVEGDGDVGFTLFDVYAIPLLDVNEGTFGVEFGTARTEFSAPYLVWVWKNGDKPADFIVSSNRNLALLGDQDDGRRISLGQTLGAALDQPADLDYFLLDLAEGDTVEITVDSLLIDPFLAVRYIGATDLQVIIDDDSGGGFSDLIPRSLIVRPTLVPTLLEFWMPSKRAWVATSLRWPRRRRERSPSRHQRQRPLWIAHLGLWRYSNTKYIPCPSSIRRTGKRSLRMRQIRNSQEVNPKNLPSLLTQLPKARSCPL